MTGKSFHEMDYWELRRFVVRQEVAVAKLSHKRPGSDELKHAEKIYEDARQVLSRMLKENRKKRSQEQ